MLTVRLPDLSSPSAAPPGTAEPGHNRDERVGPPGLPLQDTRGAAPELLRRGVFARVYQFVGQPKFWLACLTAIGVQVVLALVFSPAAPKTDSHAPRKSPVPPERAAATRIVVPPAESPPARAGIPSADALAAPQMQPAPPADAAMLAEPPTTSATPLEGAATSSDSIHTPRLAEQRGFARQQRYDGQTGSEALGATLEQVVPVDDVDLQQPNGGSRR